MIKIRTKILKIPSLLAIGVATFAGATLWPADEANARIYRISVPISGTNLVPGSLRGVKIECRLYEGVDATGNSVGFGNWTEGISETSSTFSATKSVTNAHPDVNYLSYKCILLGYGESTSGAQPFSASAEEPFTAHPGSVVSVQGNIGN